MAFSSAHDHALLQIVRGATSCQVGQGSWKPGSTDAIFIVDNAVIKVAILDDPVFGVKVATTGALIQVKKGTVQVGAARGSSSTAVGAGRQIAVSNAGLAVGGLTPLASDPELRHQLCTLTPDLSLTNVVAASGAKPGGDPLALAPDLNGNIWFTDDVTPAIGVYRPTTGKIRYVDGAGLNPGSVPRFIATDTSGEVWFTDTGRTPAIGRIDPRTGTITEYSLPPGSVPWAPAYDPVDHLLWFTDQRKPTGAIGSIDPATNRIAEYDTGLRTGSHPEGIAVDAKGIVWFTDDNSASPALGTLDPATHAIHEFSTGLVPGSLPRGITIGADGNVWFADERTADNHQPNQPGDGLVGTTSTTDPSHRIVEYPVAANGGNVHSIPEGLAWYRGYVWFTDDGATKAVGRIDPRTGAITESSKALVADSKPIGILVTKGVLWFTDRLAGSPRIGRLVAKASC